LLKIKIKSKTMTRKLKTPQQILDKNPKFSFTIFLFSSSTQPNRKFKNKNLRPKGTQARNSA
jgi:hypothetical protein